MQTCTKYVTLAYSKSSLSFSGRAGTPFGQTSPCLLFGTYFFSFCQSCSLRLFTGTHPEFRGIAQRWWLSVDKNSQQATQALSTVQKSQTCRQCSMQTRVFQIALFKGFPNIPHIPPPLGHSAGTNEATMTATPENAPCWHVPQRPREICAHHYLRVPLCPSLPPPSLSHSFSLSLRASTAIAIPRQRQERHALRLQCFDGRLLRPCAAHPTGAAHEGQSSFSEGGGGSSPPSPRVEAHGVLVIKGRHTRENAMGPAQLAAALLRPLSWRSI